MEMICGFLAVTREDLVYMLEWRQCLGSPWKGCVEDDGVSMCFRTQMSEGATWPSVPPAQCCYWKEKLSSDGFWVFRLSDTANLIS